MKVRIDGRRVDVLDHQCATRSCFWLGFDKGTYVPGRGYVSYHRDAKNRRVEYPVCWTRHLHGCPLPSICPRCRTLQVEGVIECASCRVPVEPYPRAEA